MSGRQAVAPMTDEERDIYWRRELRRQRWEACRNWAMGLLLAAAVISQWAKSCEEERYENFHEGWMEGYREGYNDGEVKREPMAPVD